MDLKERLSRIVFLTVQPDLTGMSQKEVAALKECVSAARLMTDVYLLQLGAQIPALHRQFGPQSDVERYLQVHGGPWDEFNGDEPFVPGVGTRPPGVGMYPTDLSLENWKRQVASAPPAERDELESAYTRIIRVGESLRAQPYAEAYREVLEEAATHLRKAATLLSPGPLSQFLRLEADAFTNNDYDTADRAWVATTGDPFELTIGPQEVYFDKFAGLKAAFESVVGIPDRQASASLEKFGPAVPAFDAELAQRYHFKPSGAARPLEVIADVFRGGASAFGYLFVAYNLPNNRVIRTEVGSKSVFSATMMQAKFDHLVLPIGQEVLTAEDLAACSFTSSLQFVLGHELAHGIGPSVTIVDGQEVPFEKRLGTLHSCIEEAKADMLGVALQDHFVQSGLLTRDELVKGVITEALTFVRQWINGFTEAHARGNLVQYNWMAARKAMGVDRRAGKLWMDPDRMIPACIDLAYEFIALQQAGDFVRADAFLKQWGAVPDDIAELMTKVAHVPRSVSVVYDI